MQELLHIFKRNRVYTLTLPPPAYLFHYSCRSIRCRGSALIIIDTRRHYGRDYGRGHFPTRGIRIVAKSRALGKVLEEIEQESGILFKASPHIAEKQIDETIMAPDWTIAVRKLLREYSRVEILKSDGTLQRVLILDTGGPDYQLPLPLHPKDLSIPKPIRIPQPPPNATH